jgi:hypothetical protein
MREEKKSIKSILWNSQEENVFKFGCEKELYFSQK